MKNRLDEDIKFLTKDLVQSCINRYKSRIKVLDNCVDFECNNFVRNRRCDPQIMYKLRNSDGSLSFMKDGREYTFLVEFDPDDFAYGIYFGCRCTLDKKGVIETQVDICNEEWSCIKNYVIVNLNNTFVDLDFSNREIPTDNVSDGTYWPFWFRLGEDEDVEEVAALATKIIRNTYQWFFEDENYDKILKQPVMAVVKRGPKKNTAIQTRYTNKEYDQIIEKLKHATFKDGVKKRYCEGAEIYFERFMSVLLRLDIIRPHHIYEKCWVVNGVRNCDFADIIAAFSSKISTNAKTISWSLFSPIILSSTQGVFDEIRKQYGNCSEHKRGTSSIIKQIISEVFY